MSKYFRFLLLALLAFSLLAAPAFAGTTSVNATAAGSNYTAAVETLGVAQNVTIAIGAVNAQATTVPVGYTLGQALSTGNLVQVTLNGAAFQNTTYILCAGNSGAGVLNATIATLTSTGNATSQNFQIGTLNGAGTGSSAGNTIWATNALTCNTVTTSGNFPVTLSKQTGAGTATVAIGVETAGGIAVDSTSTKTLATFNNEYAPTLSSADTITIDYLGTPGNGTQLAVFGGAGNKTTAGSANKLVVTQTPQDLDAQNSVTTAALGGLNAALAMNATVALTDSLTSWAGINSVYITATNSTTGTANSPACIPANIAAGTNSPSGTITLSVPVATWNGGGNLSLGICASTSGAVLPTRTITGTYQVAVPSTAVQTIPVSASANLQVWGLNGYQAILPWLTLSSTVPTYCLVNNSNSTTANMFLNVISNDVGSTAASLSLGTIAANTSQLLLFNNSGVSSISATGTATVLNSLSGVTFTGSSSERYAGQFTVAAPQNGVTVSCAQTDPVTGGKRPVAVLTIEASSGGPQWHN